MKKLILLNLMLLLISWSLNAQTATEPSGNGTEATPYQIANLQNLYWITSADAVVTTPSQAVRFAAHYIQIADIDASATSTWLDGGWIPIGNMDASFNDHPFRGTYDGQGHFISGLTINRTSQTDWYQGLFGSVNGATIQNLGLLNVNILVNRNVGGLAGYVSSGIIINCHTTGLVAATSTESGFSTGGLVASTNNSSLTNCFSTCSVSGNAYNGGLIGHSSLSTITYCHSTGNVGHYSNTSNSHTGGLAGLSQGSSFSKCYSTGNVNASGDINSGNITGGFVGATWRFFTSPNTPSSITDCYSSGNVNGGYLTGGFAGRNDFNYGVCTITNCFSRGSVTGNGVKLGFVAENTGTVSNCFFDADLDGLPSISGTDNYGATGKSTAEMKTLSTFTGWDFLDIWVLDEGYNDGYPFLVPVSDCTNGTISLYSGSNTQIVCANTEIECITYAVNTGTMHTVGASISPALPPGLIGAWLGEENRYMICGTPTFAGTYTYTITTIGTSFSCSEATATGTITVNSSFTPTVSITSSDADNKICTNDVVTFTATPGNTGGGTVSYAWFLRGITWPAWNQQEWSYGDFDGGEVVRCEITVIVGSCLTSAVSNIITTNVYDPNSEPPTVIITSSDDDNKICDGTGVTFTAIPANTGGGTVSYTWMYNGNSIGSDKNTHWSDELHNGDVVSCLITVTGRACFDGTATATSNEIITTVNPTGGTATTTTSSVCPGKTAVLTLTGYLGTIQWQYSDGRSEPVDVIGGTGSMSDVYTTPPLTENTYFIAKVTGGTCSPTYSNEVLITVASNCSDANDCFEPNNTISPSLFSIPVNYEITTKLANSKDVDWYRFDANDDAKYTLKYYNSSGATLPTVDLYGSNGRKLRSIDRTQPNSYNLLTGTYYIKVSATGLKSSMCYYLEVSNVGAIVGAISTAADETKSAKIEPVSDGIIKIWPNPTKNEFQFYNGNETPVMVRVMDVIGRTIETIENVGIAETVVFGSKYIPGVYMVETVENGAPKVLKLIKQ